MNVVKIPYFKKRINEIWYPFAAALSLTRTFAAAPMIVKFPPRHAPSDKHHHNGVAKVAPSVIEICEIIGAIVAVYGILSIIPDKIPDPHNITIEAADCEPWVTSNSHLAINSIPPAFSNPPIIINKPMKKKIVFHSTSFIISVGFSNNNKILASYNKSSLYDWSIYTCYTVFH